MIQSLCTSTEGPAFGMMLPAAFLLERPAPLWPRGMPPKRLRCLLAPESRSALPRPLQHRRARTLGAPRTRSRTPSPLTRNVRSRTLATPTTLERRLRKRAWTPAEPFGGAGIELEVESSDATSSDTAAPKAKARQRTLGITAKKRRKLVAQAVAEGRVADALGFLEVTSVQDKTGSRYVRALEELRRHLPHGVSLDDDNAVDAAVAKVLNVYFLEGHPPAKGETTLAALMWKFPAYVRFGVKKLARVMADDEGMEGAITGTLWSSSRPGHVGRLGDRDVQERTLADGSVSGLACGDVHASQRAFEN